jgi:hypothetical protein
VSWPLRLPPGPAGVTAACADEVIQSCLNHPRPEEWHRIIRASVRECLETWVLQAQAGSVTGEALEAIPALTHTYEVTQERIRRNNEAPT